MQSYKIFKRDDKHFIDGVSVTMVDDRRPDYGFLGVSMIPEEAFNKKEEEDDKQSEA